MKKNILFLVLFLLTHSLIAQISYSYSLSDVNAAMPTGVKMPDGTYIKVVKLTTGTGLSEAGTGSPGPFLGGQLDSLWSGCPGCTASNTTSNNLPTYTGESDPTKFSRLFQSLASNVDRGKNKNCQDAIGWRIYFDRPLDINSFLVVDLDGNQAVNGEWSAAFSYNGTAFSNPSAITFQTNNLQAQNITVNASHAWRTMLQTEIGATAKNNFPSGANGFNITRIKNIAGALDPDDLKTQVLYDFTLATDLFFLWGIWGTVSNNGSQNSGISPIIVNIYPDFGDAPDSYGTLLSSNGPSHGRQTAAAVNELRLGATEDVENDGLPTANANSSMDDDGITTIPVIPNDGSSPQIIPSYSLTTSYTNRTGSDATFVAWIDWNNNGVFDPSEGQTATTSAATTNGNVTFTWTNQTLSGTTGLVNTYARIRVTTDTGLTTATTGGSFKNGEVEDYLLPFDQPLPLTLIDFSGHLVERQASLNWRTADETKVNYFEVEMSEDAIEFKAIGQVQANNNEFNNYTFDYALSNTATNFYFRLKMVDLDGSYRYSQIIELTPNIRKELIGQINPNPIGSEINFIYDNSIGEFQLEMEVLDLTGKVLWSRTERVEQGHNTIHFSSNNLTQGMYLLRYYSKGYETNGLIRFVVSP